MSPTPPAPPPQASSLLAFVPARDHALSKAFYQDLGFTLTWGDAELAELRLGDVGFLLQNFYLEALASNFMMQLRVPDVDRFWQRIQALDLPERYPGVRAKAPAMQPWGMRVLFISDPSGVLWHIAEVP